MDDEKQSKAEKDDENLAKPLKKAKISEDIAIELVINDVTDPTEDDLKASIKK